MLWAVTDLGALIISEEKQNASLAGSSCPVHSWSLYHALTVFLFCLPCAVGKLGLGEMPSM